MDRVSNISSSHQACYYDAFDFIRDVEKATSYRISEEEIRTCSIRSVRNRMYHSFDIPKKNGDARHIVAPIGVLKITQKAISNILTNYYKPNSASNGFVPGKSVVNNAQPHVGALYVLNIDIQDFFPSITAPMIYNALKRAGFDETTSLFITSVCTWTDSSYDLPEDILPQGAPTSPILSNIVCDIMDRRLNGLASRFGLNYTRYADDITFSSQHSVYAKDSDFWQELRSIINITGFRINESKTRLLKRGARQEVTGLTVGAKLNVSRKWIKNLRAQIFHLEMYGCTRQEYQSIIGKLAFLNMVCGEDERYQKMRTRVLSRKYATPFLDEHLLSGHQEVDMSEEITINQMMITCDTSKNES